MAFKIKDLMISVLPPSAGPNVPCGGCSYFITHVPIYTPACPPPPPICAGCSVHCSNVCSGSASYPGPWFDPGRPFDRTGTNSIEGLGILKQQLRQAIEEVEIRERVLEETLKPKTLGEVEQLEQLLTEALAELRIRKVELQNPGKDKC